MQHLLPWILASLSIAILAIAGVTLLFRRHRVDQQVLPAEWALTARPVFSSGERRLYRLLREALPHHVVLAKLPLVRFCQPNDPSTVRYWYGLLGSNHVNFAICSPNGRVLAVIDIEGDRPASRRNLEIRQSVLAACRVRHLRCTADRLPSVPELQQLVPQGSAGSGSAATPARRDRATLWQDSGFMQDSFFGMDGRNDVSTGGHSTGNGFASSGNGGFGSSRPTPLMRDFPPKPDDVGGVVIDTPASSLRH